MRCAKVRAKLNSYIDGELSERTSAQVREHCEECPGCANRFAELRRLNAALEGLPEMEASPFFASRVKSRAEQRLRAAADASSSKPTLLSPLSATAALIVLAFGVVLGGMLGWSVSAARTTAPRTSESGTAERLEVDPLTALSPDSVGATYLEVSKELY